MATKLVTVYDVDFIVHFDYEPYIPAKVSGPPENCHPAEGGEVSINDILIDNWNVTDILSSHVADQIKVILEEQLPEIEAADKEQAAMDRAEANRMLDE